MASLGKRAVERRRRRALIPAAAVLLAMLMAAVSDGQPLVPAVILFGDSTADAGNNNGILTIIKANFPPYGRDFPGHTPTGRFCNGKLAVDFMVETLGFDAYPPAYLGPDAAGGSILNGTNFASGGSGYLHSTALLYDAVSLTQQLSYYKEYQGRVEQIAGNKTRSAAIFAGGVHLLSAGTSDFLQNYYINPVYHLLYTPSQFADLLVASFTSFVKELHGLGARKVGVTSLPPMGCLPASITLYGDADSSGCVEALNHDAAVFNEKLNATAGKLAKELPGLVLVVFDIYKPLLDLIHNPSSGGFCEARRACCGTGTVETSLLCNAKSLGTCSNATGYVFWDAFHPSEAANKALADVLLVQGIALIS